MKSIETIKNTWIFLILGVVWLVLAIYIQQLKFITLQAPVLYITIAIAITGILNFYFALSNRKAYTQWAWFVISAFFDFLIGILFFNLRHILIGRSSAEFAILDIYLSIWLIFHSALSLIFAWELNDRKVSVGGILLMLLGMAGMVSAIIILFNPFSGNTNLKRWIFLSFLVLGIYHLAAFVGLKIRGYKQVRVKLQT